MGTEGKGLTVELQHLPLISEQPFDLQQHSNGAQK